MGQGEVFVNRVARLQGTLVAETDMPSGVLRTPAFVPKVITQPEFDLLLSQDYLRKTPEMVCYEIMSVRRLTANRARMADQRTITGASADPVYDRFRKSTFSMTDPMTEYFSYKRAYSGSGDDKVYLRDKIARLQRFPRGVLEILRQSDSPWDEKFWQEIIDNELHIALIDWYAWHQRTVSPAILPAPSNVVKGNRSLEISMQLNEATGAAFPVGEDRLVPAFYLILHPKVFKSEAFMETLRGHISSILGVFKVLVLKFLFFDTVVNSAIRRGELFKLLSHVDELKRQSEDSFLVMALDIGEAGIALVANGFDAYVEPLSGFIWFPQARGRTKEERAREEEDLDIETKQDYWLHPITRTELPMTVEAIGEVCDCPVHEEAPQSSEKRRRTLRKVHHYNVRSREIDFLVEAVGHEDAGFFDRILKKGHNKNLLSLLPALRDEAGLGIKR